MLQEFTGDVRQTVFLGTSQRKSWDGDSLLGQWIPRVTESPPVGGSTPNTWGEGSLLCTLYAESGPKDSLVLAYCAFRNLLSQMKTEKSGIVWKAGKSQRSPAAERKGWQPHCSHWPLTPTSCSWWLSLECSGQHLIRSDCSCWLKPTCLTLMTGGKKGHNKHQDN
jgi:hypothetical protein